MGLLAGLITRFMVLLNLIQMLISIHITRIINIIILFESSNLRFTNIKLVAYIPCVLLQIYNSAVGSTAFTVYIPIIMWTLKISILFLWIETSGQEKRWYWEYYGVYLKHPRSPTTGNWLGYTVFNTIYWCLLYLKV